VRFRSPLRRQGGGRYLAVAAAALVVGGVAILGIDGWHKSGPPRPAAAGNVAQVPTQRPTSAAKVQALAKSVPVRIDIPSIGVHAKTLSMGADAEGGIAVPSLAQAELTSWYNEGPAPGEVGPSVIVGHVDTKSGPAVFYRLGELKKGATIDVARTDGSVVSFAVDSVAEYPKAEFPAEKIFSDLDYPGLRLITCGGAFDSDTGHYLDNTIVFGHMTGSHHA
jgi:hypothetical protein